MMLSLFREQSGIRRLAVSSQGYRFDAKSQKGYSCNDTSFAEKGILR
jgi:hypothetical protein